MDTITERIDSLRRCAGGVDMTHYCEFPTFPDLNGGENDCGQPACAKINGSWFCVLHEDAAENLEPNEQDAALDDLLD